MPGAAPPGRAGRLWYGERIATARRAAELLEHKQQLLRHEQRRLAGLAERTGSEWRERATEAERWQVRALVAGGRDEIRRAAARIAPASVELTWANHAGVVYPATASMDPGAGTSSGGNPALARATAAGREALAAAVQHAAASRALARVDAELAVTVRRLRAVRDRWLPELERRHAALDLALEEMEREEGVRLRWARPPAVALKEVR
jgi:V/A-type H+/Na+-transporting ATPase subunit D